MTISAKRKTILDDLKSWLSAIKKGDTYQSTVRTAKRGIHYPDEMLERPALCIWNQTSRKTDLANSMVERALDIVIFGYVDIQPDDYDALDALITDVEECLNGSLADWDSSIIEVDVGDVSIYEGGSSDKIGVFEMALTIMYQYDNDSA